jgi:ParB-like chromosome segregation protein Spo0J
MDALAPGDCRIEVLPDELSARLARVRLVPPTDVALAASLRRFGQLSPLVVYRDGSQLEVVDGFRRLRSAGEQGVPTRLWVRVLELDGTRALAALFALHRGAAGLSELEEAWVVQALVREHGLVQQQVAQLLRRHQSWVSRRLLLVESLAPQVQDDVRLGLLSPWAAREIARLPRGIQPEVARAVATHGLSSRQTARLAAAVARHGAGDLERLCAQLHDQPRPRTVAAWYAADLALLARVATRLLRRLHEQPPATVELRAQLRATAPVVHALDAAFTHALEDEP